MDGDGLAPGAGRDVAMDAVETAGKGDGDGVVGAGVVLRVRQRVQSAVVHNRTCLSVCVRAQMRARELA